MRKTIRFTQYVLMAGFLFFYACKKEIEELKATEEVKAETPVQKELAAKVTSWLEAQQLNFTGSRAEKIESLKQSLLQGGISLEAYRTNEQLIVVPLAANFKSSNNADKHTVNYLVVVLADGVITKGNIIQFAAENGQRPISNNTFSKVFTYQNTACNGKFIVLSIADDFRYELTFEMGKLKSLAEPNSKPKEENAGARTSACIDWYLVTYYFWDDGTVTVTENYLYTWCAPDDSDCAQPKLINGRSLGTSCSGSGAGGGGDIDYEYEITKAKMWVIYQSPDGLNTVRSNEWLTGKKRPNNDSYFTVVSHQDDGVQNTLGDTDASAATWIKYDDSCSYSLSNGNKTATVTISGELTYSTKPKKILSNKTQSWGASVL